EEGVCPRPAGTRVAIAPALAGRHQLDNAALAAALAWHALPDRTRFAECVAEGVLRVQWPGRLERIANVLFDCAHNEEAARALAQALAEEPPAVLLFGALEDKAWRPMLDVLAPLAAERVYCEPIGEVAGRRSVAPELLAE